MSLINKLLKERYKLTELIAEGGMASVYKGTDTMLHRIVAVKVLRENFAMNDELVERFYREARSAARLSNPHIVNIYDIGNEDNIYFIVMEYLDGGTLDGMVSQDKPFPIEEVIRFGSEICEALDYAHNKGVIHRDIKAQNVMLAEDKTIKVVDFGIARLVDTGTMTKPGTVMGSVYYFSPEQAEGKEATSASDIYSTGVLLYYLSTGKYPFDGEHVVAIALKHIKDEPISPRDLNRAIPDDLERIILKAMSKSPSDRYKNAADMLHALKNIKLGPSVSQKPEVDIIDDDIDIDELYGHSVSLDKTIIRKAPPPVLKKEVKPPEEKKVKKKNNTPVIIFIIAAILVMGFLSGLVITKFIFPPHGAKITVPSLFGKSEDDAKKLLEDGGLILEVSEKREDDNVPEGKIISQSPEGGTLVEKNSKVKVVISLGKKSLVKVPNIIGKNIDDATSELEIMKLNISIEEIEEIYMENYPPGSVISQEPVAGTEVEANSIIKVKINKKIEDISVPNVIGLTENEAKELLSSSEFKLKVVKEEPGNKEKGQILSQNPEGGKKAPKNSTVEVVISSGPEMLIVPDLTGLTFSEAKAALADLNLTIVLKEGQSEEGVVDSQNPPPGGKISSENPVEVILKNIETIIVPDLIGKLLYDAKNELENSKLVAGEVTEVSSKEVPGTVIEQYPKSGSSLQEGSAVNLTVAKMEQPEKVSVPDLKGLSLENAIKELEKTGLKAGSIEMKTGDQPKNLVISQSLPAGMSVEKGTGVNLVVSQ